MGAAKAEASEGKATAEGDLQETVKMLKDTKESLSTASGSCMTTASDHEATVNARNEELKAIATARKILEETTGGGEGQTYLLFFNNLNSKRIALNRCIIFTDIFGNLRHHAESVYLGWIPESSQILNPSHVSFPM